MLDLDRLIDALDLADLATRAGAKLHKAGRQMRSTCPLHAGSDNPTSFCVHTPHGSGRQLWVCHKCGGGDALGFIMKWQNLEFMDAVKWGAQEARIPLTELGLTEEAVKEHQVREKRRDVLDVASRFYQRQFRRNPIAVNYALNRGFTARTLTRFGFSQGRGLGEYLTAHNADLGLAREIGLLRGDGRDFTSNHDGDQAAPTGWIIYIHRRAGRVDYVSARALRPVDPNDKSRNLPGHKQLYRCEADSADEMVALVEGQADAETLRQIGVSAWALCGTSLDEETDLSALRRRKVYLALDDDTHRDGDEGLRESRRLSQAARLMKLADKLGPLTLMAPELPNDKAKDLNEWLQLKPDLSRKEILGWLKQSRPWVERRIAMAAEAGPLEQAEHICDIAHLLARLPEPVKAKWYKSAGKALDMTPAELKSASGQDGHGPAAEIKEGQLCIYGVPLLTGAAWIKCELSMNDGANAPKVHYQIAGRLKTGEPLHELNVQATDFEALGWMSEWGARLIKLVSRGRYHEVARAIQEISLNNNGASMKREDVFAYTGLATVNGERGFLSKSGRLTPTGLDPAVRVDLGEFNLNYTLPDPPKGEALREAVRQATRFLIIAPRRVTAPLFAAAAAAPLTSVRPLNTVIWIYGTTTTGKSIIAHLAVSFFAPGVIGPRRFNPMIGWSSTITTLEAAMFAAKDMPLCIDDFAPQFADKLEASKLRGTADKLIRSLGNRMARGRSRSDESVRRVRNPRALVMATAENPIEGQSINHRLVYVNVEKGDVIKSSDEGNALLNEAEEAGAAGLYAGAMSAYICRLLPDWDKRAEQFAAAVDAEVGASRGKFASGLDRQPDYYAVLSCAQRSLLNEWAEMGALNKVQAGRIADENQAAILEVVQGQAGRIAEQSPAVMFLRAIDSALEQRKAYLAPRKSTQGWNPPDRSERIGWFDAGDRGAIWLHTDTALGLAKDYYQRLDLHFDVSRDSLNRLMAQSGLLRRTDGARAEVSIWTGQRNDRALEVDVAKVKASEALGLDLTYPKTPAPDADAEDRIKELL